MHDPGCKWPQGEPCSRFSTDGTRLGAAIAHEMGTTDEQEIVAQAIIEDYWTRQQNLTGMAEEQAEWEEYP